MNRLCTAASGCPYDEPEDPGNLEFDWVEAKLTSYRERGMQVWIIGTDCLCIFVLGS